MRNTLSSFLLLLAMIALVSACRPKDDFPEGTTGEYYAKESIAGSWRLSSVKQIDNSQPSNFPDSIFALKSLDLASIYPGYSKVTANFESNANGDGTYNYTVLNPDTVQMYLPQTGQWKINAESTGASLKLKGPYLSDSDSTFSVSLTPAYRVNENKLSLTVSRKVEGKAVLSYQYNFVR
jgi:hypothetical protein